jgi:hypothetical protein
VPASKLLGWLITAVLVGWIVVYNAFRLSGDSPREAAWISLGIGAAAGLVAFGIGWWVHGRLLASGRLRPRAAVELPSPEEVAAEHGRVVRLTVALIAALAAAGLVVGIAMAVDWARVADSWRDNPTRSILALWDLLIAVWLGSEIPRLLRNEVDGLESIVLGCILTAVLAGVALSDNVLEAAQVVLIVLAGLAGAMTQFLVWRLSGSRGLPLGSAGVLVVAALALILPLTL